MDKRENRDFYRFKGTCRMGVVRALAAQNAHLSDDDPVHIVNVSIGAYDIAYCGRPNRAPIPFKDLGFRNHGTEHVTKKGVIKLPHIQDQGTEGKIRSLYKKKGKK